MTIATQSDGAAPNTPEVSLASAIPPDELDRLPDEIVAALKTVYDPEIPADIYELGLIYRVEIDNDRNATIDMSTIRGTCSIFVNVATSRREPLESVHGIRTGTALALAGRTRAWARHGPARGTPYGTSGICRDRHGARLRNPRRASAARAVSRR